MYSESCLRIIPSCNHLGMNTNEVEPEREGAPDLLSVLLGLLALKP